MGRITRDSRRRGEESVGIASIKEEYEIWKGKTREECDVHRPEIEISYAILKGSVPPGMPRPKPPKKQGPINTNDVSRGLVAQGWQ